MGQNVLQIYTWGPVQMIFECWCKSCSFCKVENWVTSIRMGWNPLNRKLTKMKRQPLHWGKTLLITISHIFSHFFIWPKKNLKKKPMVTNETFAHKVSSLFELFPQSALFIIILGDGFVPADPQGGSHWCKSPETPCLGFSADSAQTWCLMLAFSRLTLVGCQSWWRMQGE